MTLLWFTDYKIEELCVYMYVYIYVSRTNRKSNLDPPKRVMNAFSRTVKAEKIDTIFVCVPLQPLPLSAEFSMLIGH